MINTSDGIIMYGVLVGKAIRPIQKGELIHVHNIKHASSGREAYHYEIKK